MERDPGFRLVPGALGQFVTFPSLGLPAGSDREFQHHFNDVIRTAHVEVRKVW
jgi:hypothetical protein